MWEHKIDRFVGHLTLLYYMQKFSALHETETG